ncbi:hypothetical protein ElyMa_001235600 [Elysia marginata]|uniref:Uncharacterized protein n=1 Tax=Elysia marginata TaxID=1093978 RepID=A0AAV4ICK0_9GAST|nr:hypothetical protein ElyMa_001235600 [Elysia marginata]
MMKTANSTLSDIKQHNGKTTISTLSDIKQHNDENYKLYTNWPCSPLYSLHIYKPQVSQVSPHRVSLIHPSGRVHRSTVYPILEFTSHKFDLLCDTKMYLLFQDLTKIIECLGHTRVPLGQDAHVKPPQVPLRIQERCGEKPIEETLPWWEQPRHMTVHDYVAGQSRMQAARLANQPQYFMAP